MQERRKFFYDWEENGRQNRRKIELNDETLRDGLQATYIQHPSLEEKKELLRLMDVSGIESANIGFPISSKEQYRDVLALAKYKRHNNLTLSLGCGARMMESDVVPILEIMQKTGVELEIGVFIGSSEARRFVEKWNLKEMGRKIRQVIRFITEEGARVMFVTEDTTRAQPKTIEYLYKQAIDNGAARVCVCDTVGCATPSSVKNLLKFFLSKVVQGENVAVDWHGHNDRGLAIANSLVAASMGVDRIQVTALGVGERVGNASLEQLATNLKIMGHSDYSLSRLSTYIQFASKVLRYPIRENDPVIGRSIFSTATGVHAAAVKKAYSLENKQLAGLIYSGIDPVILGRKPEILIGPMSGKSNVEMVLKELEVKENLEENIQFLLKFVKKKNIILSKEKVKKLLDETK